MKNNVLRFLVVLVVVSFIFGGLWILLMDDKRFEKSVWLEGAEINYSDCGRWHMVGDLKGRVLLPGLSKDEVINLLGKPDDNPGNEMIFVLGMCSGYGFDFDFLHVIFSANDRLMEVKVMQH